MAQGLLAYTRRAPARLRTAGLRPAFGREAARRILDCSRCVFDHPLWTVRSAGTYPPALLPRASVLEGVWKGMGTQRRAPLAQIGEIRLGRANEAHITA